MLDALIKEIIEPHNKLIMVIGGPDTGKTSLVWNIAKSLTQSYNTAIVDLDMGQSHIGPPTTIAWAKMEGKAEDWSQLKVMDFYFTGTISPVKSLLPTVIGAGLITEKASSAVEKVIIDTTGLISEPVGRILKHFKIDLLMPDIVIAIESKSELSHITEPFIFCKKPKIIKMATSNNVKIKTKAYRIEYRFKKMNEYLKNAFLLEIPMEKVGIRFTRNIDPAYGITNRVASLRDKFNKDIGLGLIKGLTKNKLKIFTPITDIINLSIVVIGRTVYDVKEKSLKDY